MQRPLAIAALMLFIFCVAGGASENPFAGTWKEDLAKSPPVPAAAGPADKSNIIHREAFGKDGEKFTADRIDAQGNKFHTSYSAEYDGKDYPIQGDPRADTVSIRRIDTRTVQLTYKKAGKVAQVRTRTISQDGKTQTTAEKIVDAEGHEITDVTIWDKQ